MRYADKYGHLSALDAAVAGLQEAERGMNDEEWTYVRNEEWRLPDNDVDYNLHRLFMQIMGLQMVVLRNGGSLSFSKIPRIWWPNGKDDKTYT